MASDSAAARLAQLRDEIGYALRDGTLPEGQLREFRWLWRTTPDQEKENLQFTLKEIEELVKTFRRELTPNAGKVQRIPIEYISPDDDC
jgi:hypothetical protein